MILDEKQMDEQNFLDFFWTEKKIVDVQNFFGMSKNFFDTIRQTCCQPWAWLTVSKAVE